MGLDIPDGMSDLDVTNELYEKMVEPTLIQPTFVCRLPVELLPLAKGCPDDPRYVDVFELGINGVEVAPAYSELNDPIIQRQRFMEQFERTKERATSSPTRSMRISSTRLNTVCLRRAAWESASTVWS